jgi:hypothetical protein
VSRKQHAQAFLDLLAVTDGITPALVVQVGKVANGITPPYVLIHFRFLRPDSLNEPDKGDLTFDQLAYTVEAVCHSVGATEDSAMTTAGRVEAKVLNARPAVASRDCAPVRWVDGQGTQRDEETLTAVFDMVDVYRFFTVPA